MGYLEMKRARERELIARLHGISVESSGPGFDGGARFSDSGRPGPHRHDPEFGPFLNEDLEQGWPVEYEIPASVIFPGWAADDW